MEQKPVEHHDQLPHDEPPKKESLLGKRPSEPLEDAPEIKKPCVEDTAVLEDALSEISDDADEILNREDVSANVICL